MSSWSDGPDRSDGPDIPGWVRPGALACTQAGNHVYRLIGPSEDVKHHVWRLQKLFDSSGRYDVGNTCEEYSIVALQEFTLVKLGMLCMNVTALREECLKQWTADEVQDQPSSG